MQVLLDYLLLAHHQKRKRAWQRRTQGHTPWHWWRRLSRKRPVLERHAEHVIRLGVEHHVPGACHRLQPLLHLEAGGTIFLYEHDRAACGAYGFHRGSALRKPIRVASSKNLR